MKTESMLVKMPNGFVTSVNSELADTYARKPGHTIFLIPPPDMIANAVTPKNQNGEKNVDDEN